MTARGLPIMLLMALAVGLVAGVGAWGFRMLIGWSTTFFSSANLFSATTPTRSPTRTSWAPRLQFNEAALTNRTEAVRISRLQYTAGATDLLAVLQLHEYQVSTEAEVIKLRDTQLANRILLHLALGGSFEAAPNAGDISSSH